MPSAVRILLAVSLLLSTLVACRSAPEGGGDAASAEAEPVRVENATLGVAIADLDPFFQVASNEGDTLVLAPADDAVAGTLTMSAGEPITSGGVNLVKAIEDHKASIEERGGEFKGQRELGGPLGTAFYSRGHLPADDGTTTEETVIFTVHPAGDRVLRLTYVYPQGDDSAQRIQDQLFSVFGELTPAEASSAAPEAGEDASSEAAASGETSESGEAG